MNRTNNSNASLMAADGGRHATQARKDSGFTLIELLAVILIISILVALVVGVGVIVKDRAAEQATAARQAMLIQAIEKYRDAMSKVPDDDPSDPDGVKALYLAFHPESRTPPGPVLPGTLSAAAAIEAKLPEDARDMGACTYLDGWQRPMVYRSKGGLGGGPVIISYGSSGDSDPNKAKNWIRSDSSK